MKKEQASELLIKIGVNPSYRAFPYLTHILSLKASDDKNAFLTIKALYEDVSREFHVSPDAVQHGIRTLLEAYWAQGNCAHFHDITGCPIQEKLSPREFISILSEYLRKNA